MHTNIIEIHKTILAYIVNFFDKNISNKLTYHDINHTLLVHKNVVEIADHENINKNDIFLLKIAALFHDTGFSVQRFNHEIYSCDIATKILKEHEFSDQDILLVKGMIMATKIPQKPKNILEQIIADADLLYLGTNDFQKWSNLLFLELKQSDSNLNEEKWLNIQITFFESHHYFTSYAKQFHEEIKLENLKLLYKKSQFN